MTEAQVKAAARPRAPPTSESPRLIKCPPHPAERTVGNTWIIDLRDYLTPAGALAAELPARARILAEYFASIVVDATTNLDDPPTVQCRRSAGFPR
jgi:hypothetical protein